MLTENLRIAKKVGTFGSRPFLCVKIYIVNYLQYTRIKKEMKL